MQTGRGGVGSRKHGKSGTPGHNRDMMQTARELNKQQDESRALKKRQKGRMFGSIKELWSSE